MLKEEQMHKHILIPTDGSQLSTSAVERALAFAKDIGARVTILTVIEPFHIFSMEMEQLEATREEYDRYSRKAAEDILTAAQNQAKQSGIDCHTVQVTSNEPARVIVETATERGCDLIAMASHGREGFTAFMVGSVTMKVLAHSRTPVLVYR
jgi:nucleotide-binding universal stress UspA family protein